MALGRRRVDMSHWFRRIGRIVLFTVGIVELKFITLSSKPQMIDNLAHSSIGTRNGLKLPDPETLARPNDDKMRRNLRVIQTRRVENEKKQDSPGSDGRNESDKAGKSNNDKKEMQGDTADINYQDNNNDSGPDKQRNSNENFESNSNGAGQGNNGNSTATNNSSDQTDYSVLTAKSYDSKNSKAATWVFIVVGLSIFGSAFAWLVHSVKKRKRSESARVGKKNRKAIGNDQISDWFDKISDAYIAMEHLATDSYTDVKSRLLGYSFSTTSSANKIPNKVRDANGESSSDESVVSSLSGGSEGYLNKEILLSPFELMSGKPQHDAADLDSISICIKAARETTDLQYDSEEEPGKDKHKSSKSLFIHYVPL